MIALIDTNVIMRFLTEDNHSQYKNLHPFFNSIEKGEMRVELKLIVLFQVVFVLKSVYKVPKAQIAEGLLTLLQYKGISIKEKKIVNRTLELWRDNNIEIVDCYLAASLEGDSQNLLYSYDRDFGKLNITRIIP
ncbi:MAG: type II toxin-antitoxin system VapC family toxin [Desulfobacterales bacterium]|nr:type II toxin-antitoxin system VapC family toxin [Desulfobacterales bacterium]